MNKVDVPWCVMDASIIPVHRCMRCGEIEVIKYPILVEDYVNQAKKFCKDHQNCIVRDCVKKERGRF